MSLGREWVYYIPEFNALVILRPDWVDKDGLPPTEWDAPDLHACFTKYKNSFRLDARKESDKRNCIYIGDL